MSYPTQPRKCVDCDYFYTRNRGGRCDSCRTAAKRNISDQRRVKMTGASRALRRQLNEVGGGVCAHCGERFPADELCVDHILALRFGGRDSQSNLQLLCASDHAFKSGIEETIARTQE
jgi:5-methylcytosine-specific restriction endonuclease McrA